MSILGTLPHDLRLGPLLLLVVHPLKHHPPGGLSVACLHILLKVIFFLKSQILTYSYFVIVGVTLFILNVKAICDQPNSKRLLF